MTVQELNDEESQSQKSVGERGTTLARPPSYEEERAAAPMPIDHNMLEPFKHVSIPPPIPAPDEQTIDIRVDDEHELIPQYEAKSEDVRRAYLTPHRICRDITQSPFKARCQFYRFDPNESADLKKSKGRSSSISGASSTDSSLSIAPSTSSQAAAAVAAASASNLPSLTSDNMWEALPAREAVFLADSMQWLVVKNGLELDKDGKRTDIPPSLPFESKFSLWQYEGDIHIPVDRFSDPMETLLPATEGTQPEIGLLDVFERWTSTQGGVLLITKTRSLPSVIPVELMESLRAERTSHPRPGQTGDEQFKEAVTTLIKIIGNAANGEVRALSVTGKAITSKLGVDDISRMILHLLGFTGEGKPDANGLLPNIKPPDMTQKQWQIKLRRAWLEILMWYQYTRTGTLIKNDQFVPEVLTSIPLMPRYINALPFLSLNFNFDQETQVENQNVHIIPTVEDAFELLGADSNAVEPLVEECYVANTSGLSLPEKAPYYTALQTVGQYFHHSKTDLIQTRLGIEKSHGLFSESDLKEAYAKIGIVNTTMDQIRQIDNDFLVSMYTEAVAQHAAKKQQVQLFKDALEIISASRGNPKEIEEAIAAPVELKIAKAYEILEVNSDIDDDFVSSVFSVNLGDGARSSEECIEALRVIAEDRKSSSLRKLYRSAIGEAEEWEAPDLEKPIGLHNIGNTCYLNSVLQYFFAIRQLREYVILASKGEEEIKLSDTSSVRVGGRQISVREIERSHRFVKQLAQLFSNMISSPASAVTPERELAYLALVSSRVEEISEVSEVDTAQKSSTPAETVAMMQISNPDSGTSTEATLVDEPINMSIGETDEGEDSKRKASQSSTVQEDDNAIKDVPPLDQDISTTPPTPSFQAAPPLPPRPAANVFDATNEVGQRRNSLMRLGAQQDVSECLDNVMFQVEVALVAKEQDGLAKKGNGIFNESNEADEEWSDNDDLLRRLFMGRTLQRTELASQGDDRKGRGPSIHIKREVFTILPIDVVEEGKDIYDGLDGFFEEEILDGSGGEPIRRTVTLTDAPAIMQIQLQRVQYDRIKGAYKSQAHLETGQSLFMDRYLDFNPLEEEDVKRLEKRKLGREARRRIEELRARARALEPEKTPVSKTLKQTSEFLNSVCDTMKKVKAKQGSKEDMVIGNDELEELCGDSSFNQFLGQEATRVDEELKATEKEIIDLKSKVEELWKDENRYEYILASVFMHRGEASHGHYFLNQRRLTEKDSEPSSIWYKYNDQTVTEIKWSEVHRDQSGATPYLLCWVRKDKLDHFDSLCRHYEMAEIGTVEESKSNSDKGEKKKSIDESNTVDDKENANVNATNIDKPQDDVIMTEVSPTL